jgi:hypothetical protein
MLGILGSEKLGRKIPGYDVIYFGSVTMLAPGKPPPTLYPQNRCKHDHIISSPVPSRLREPAHARVFRALLRRMPKIADCVAERAGFELSGDFVNRQ